MSTVLYCCTYCHVQYFKLHPLSDIFGDDLLELKSRMQFALWILCILHNLGGSAKCFFLRVYCYVRSTFASCSPSAAGLFSRFRLQGTQEARRGCPLRRTFGPQPSSVARGLGVQGLASWLYFKALRSVSIFHDNRLLLILYTAVLLFTALVLSPLEIPSVFTRSPTVAAVSCCRPG